MCGTEPSGGYNTPPLAHTHKKKNTKKDRQDIEKELFR